MFPTPDWRGKKGLLTLQFPVPERFKSIDKRRFVRLSLKTDNLTFANQKVAKTYQLQIAAWEAELAEQGADVAADHAALKNTVEARGFAYIPADEVSELPTAGFVGRLGALQGVADLVALAGGTDIPDVLLSGLFEQYQEYITDKIRNRSPDQMRR